MTVPTRSASQTRGQWAWPWSVLILLLTCLPYLIAVWLSPAGWHFAGFLVNPLDGHSYLAKMRQGYDGAWLFHLTYTAEPHQGTFIFTFYLLLGRLAALTRLPLILVFHLARLLAGFLFLHVAIRFLSKIFTQPREQKLAFVLLATASGLGWLGVLFGAFPIDLWIPEAFSPYSLYANPHFPLSMALMLVILERVTWPPAQTGPLKQLVWNGLAGLALALVLPFALLTLGAVVAVYLIWLFRIRLSWPWSQFWPALGVALFSAPVILYDVWVSTTNPILAGWGAQNVTPAPSLLNLGLGYGLVGLLALAGAWHLVRQRAAIQEPALGLILLWAGVTLLLLYAPLALQRRLMTGLHLPVVVLATIGLGRLGQWLRRPRQFRLLSGAVVGLSAWGTLFVWILPLLALRQLPDSSPTAALFFMRQEEVAAFDWLRENIAASEVVLASPRLGMFIPGQTGGRSYYGHPFETVQAEVKRKTVEAFFQGELARLPQAVDYIIYEPATPAQVTPAGLAQHPVVFSQGSLKIYKIN